MVKRERIYSRLRIKQITVGTASETDVWTSNVPERKMRNVVYIGLIGDGEASRTVNIKKKEEDGSYTTIFPSIPVPPAAQVPVPEGWNFDIENPVIVLEGGTNLGAMASGGSPKMVVIYWDIPEV